jgi:hypothetical protein
LESENQTTQAYGDLITALLFVFIIVLVAYVINFTANQLRTDDMAEKMSQIRAMRSHIVQEVSQRLDYLEIDHRAKPQEGIIRMTAKTLAFETASYHLSDRQKGRMRGLARALAGVIPCYTSDRPKGVVQELDCPDGAKGQLQRVVVEGHTDNVPLKPRRGLRNNVDLSAERAGTVYGILTGNQVLGQLVNKGGEKLFSVAGYGPNRPVVHHDAPKADPRNRRIDLRFTLRSPWMHGR